MTTIYDFTLKSIMGEDVSLAEFLGQPLLIVNVASRCGLTPQYAALQEIYQKYQAQGFSILGIPCNQFMEQEPGTEAEILEFCQINYKISFPLFSKIEVNGENRHPLYAYLVGEQSLFPGDITWNFEKFLIDKQGRPIGPF